MSSQGIKGKGGDCGVRTHLTHAFTGVLETSGMFIVQNGKTGVDEGGADVGEAGEVAAVSTLLPLPTTSGTGDQRPTNTGEKDAVVATMENITGAGNLIEAIVSREGGGDAGDMGRTPTTDGPLLTTDLTRSPRLRHSIPRTRRHLSLSPRRIHSPLHPLLGLL